MKKMSKFFLVSGIMLLVTGLGVRYVIDHTSSIRPMNEARVANGVGKVMPGFMPWEQKESVNPLAMLSVCYVALNMLAAGNVYVANLLNTVYAYAPIIAVIGAIIVGVGVVLGRTSRVPA